MEILITKKAYEQSKLPTREYFASFWSDVPEHEVNDLRSVFNYRHDKGRTIDLRLCTSEDLDRMEAIFNEVKGRGTGKTAVIRRVKTIRELRAGKLDRKAKSVAAFKTILTAYLETVPGHRVYRINGHEMEAFYVNSIEYHPPQKHRDYYTPPSVSMELLYRHLGQVKEKTIRFQPRDCLHVTPMEALAEKKLYPESDEARSLYLAEYKKWKEMESEIGLRVTAKGTAALDVDTSGSKFRSYWGPTSLDLGDGTFGVIDVLRESDKEDRLSSRNASIDSYFWTYNALDKSATKNEIEGDADEFYEDEVDEDEIAEVRKTAEKTEIPIHPWIPFFDFRRHERMTVHVRNMEIKPYDTTLGEKLVLPRAQRQLIDVLVGNDHTFEDIVAGKSGGSIILTAGPPGVGKTLTSEVYSEVVERPLYTVQCSQLGLDASSLEKSLTLIFGRASRWNALLLLDEADVYISKRGDNLVQNAIVGVFLRTLEYFPGTIFLTTNRGDSVDDAIASRCIARIEYKLPTPGQQAEIWSILSETSGIPMAEGAIEKIVERWPSLSGRDVKNLLKLAHMLSPTEPITFETVETVKPFKSTEDISKGPKKRKKS